ncbi:hypothetical protein CERSUDRAFT_107531 [Gelatoporia subvermispora B]|uniref:Uncharacterized protein n=1 Tax=Ceriporiopsis subvermispora (strain B) TaxID=914234 RepID=M2R7E5_CERS8|nr:hypothetical protein CERSUDRAFT_107531 [Gelatoporia subvermispora B]
MSSSESSPEPEPLSKQLKKSSKDKKKGKATKSTSIVTPYGKNEGDDPDWAYQPPPGSVLLNHAEDFGEFDWDKVKEDDNLELWLIRVPEGVKTKQLQGVKLELPPSTSKGIRVGSVERRHNTYGVWSLGEDQAETVGGEEIKSLTCLLPRKQKGGKLYQAPKPIARHLVISAQPTLPTPAHSSDSDSVGPITHLNPARHSYPKELLKHQFAPLGSLAPTGNATMDVDHPAPASKPEVLQTVPAEPPKKKRKGEGESTKKSKKAKTAA